MLDCFPFVCCLSLTRKETRRGVERHGEMRRKKIGVVKPTLSTHEKGSLISFYFIAVCLSLAISINDETMAMEIRGGVIE